MQLKFADGTMLPVLNIMGGSQNVLNATRDVLTIEVDPEVCDMTRLQSIFQNKEMLSVLKTVQEVALPNSDDSSNTTIKLEEAELSGYTLYLSAANEYREKKQEAGYLGPIELQAVNIVKIAQVTYMEMLLEQALGRGVILSGEPDEEAQETEA